MKLIPYRMVKTAVELVNVCKKYGNFCVLTDINLSIMEGDFFSILGPSGSGKTTLLKIIAGLLYPDSGKVYMYDRDCTFLPPYKRNVGVVFQDLALFPHLNVFENVAYGLRIRKLPEKEIKEKVYECLYTVNLDPEVFAKRKISQLSGGQQQRVAIARALAIEPSILLLDEPLGSLDLKLRQHMISELKRIQRKVGTTFVYVTHDQTEALILSDRIAVINCGKVEQIGTPVEIYEKPKTKFVAEFIGEMNFIQAKREGEYFLSEIGPIKLRDSNGADKILLALRPEKVVIDPKNTRNVFRGRVDEVTYLGSQISVKININGFIIKSLQPSTIKVREGEEVLLGFREEDVLTFT
ncbi:MAG: ABC transporter ATP-binding protein [Archaeoglobaceae archaeon]|nr:ABC transporter ATP-binding protein [Archaeoglobaceae archaeon]MCX8151979.1 ABC transporter ATP-binding protein [Archaeoglobaceae archaeon]MDW8013368.1 ABC transporter ATP-binding protein [Archaeoglobaceae archaeon]